jgi:hypothetical protein
MIFEKWMLEELFSFRAFYTVSEYAMSRAMVPDAVKAVAEQQMFRTLNDMAATFAMELRKEDVHYFQRKRLEDDPTITYGAYWGPVTTAVELSAPGFDRDGALYQWEGAPFKPLKVYEYPSVMWPPAKQEIQDIPMSIIPKERTFYMQAWDEARRVWIYRERRA